MAYKDSSEIATNSNYALGDYSFRIERSSVPGSSNDKIEAICTKDGKNARKSIQIPSSANVESWYVEANDTEATVYVQIGDSFGPIDATDIPCNIPTDNSYLAPYRSNQIANTSFGWALFLGSIQQPAIVSATLYNNQLYVALLEPSSLLGTYFNLSSEGGSFGAGNFSDKYVGIGSSNNTFFNIPSSQINPAGMGPTPSVEGGVYMVGRFAINLEDAGGDGPGSDWIDPGDYDPDWEEGDPTHTLYVEVTGALSGRHNDPIVDPSYSYIPADKDTVKDYGCGGDGGHGGGGGAGASTVVIHKFATNQANSKEVTAIARRHGYGSGGGKGGKGGDGCILVYY